MLQAAHVVELAEAMKSLDITLHNGSIRIELCIGTR